MNIIEIKTRIEKYRELYKASSLERKVLDISSLYQPGKLELNKAKTISNWHINFNYSKNAESLRFTDCLFEDMRLTQLFIKQGIFINCVFKEVIFKENNLRNAKFINCTFIRTNIATTSFECALFDNCVFEECSMESSNLERTLFVDSDYTSIGMVTDKSIQSCKTNGLVSTTREMIEETIKLEATHHQKQESIVYGNSAVEKEREDNSFKKVAEESPSDKEKLSEDTSYGNIAVETKQENTIDERGRTMAKLDNKILGEGIQNIEYLQFTVRDQIFNDLNSNFDFKGKTFINCTFNHMTFHDTFSPATKFIDCTFENCLFVQAVSLSYVKRCSFIETTFKTIVTNTIFENCQFALNQKSYTSFINLRFIECEGTSEIVKNGKNCIDDKLTLAKHEEHIRLGYNEGYSVGVADGYEHGCQKGYNEAKEESVQEINALHSKIKQFNDFMHEESINKSQSLSPDNISILIDNMKDAFKNGFEILANISNNIAPDQRQSLEEKVYISKVLTDEDKKRIAFYFFDGLTEIEKFEFSRGTGQFANLKPYDDNKDIQEETEHSTPSDDYGNVAVEKEREDSSFKKVVEESPIDKKNPPEDASYSKVAVEKAADKEAELEDTEVAMF